MLAAENATVIPAGNDPVPKVTAEANPLPGVIVIVVVPDAPGATVKLDGAALRANDEGNATDTVNVVAPVSIPLVPVTVIEYAPGAAELLAAMVSVLVPDPGAEKPDGANPTMIPAGNAPPPVEAAVSATGPLNPV